MLVVLTNDCVRTVVRNEPHRSLYSVSVAALERKYPAWEAAEEIPPLLFLMDKDGDYGHVMYLAHSDEERTVYADILNRTNLIINH